MGFREEDHRSEVLSRPVLLTAYALSVTYVEVNFSQLVRVVFVRFLHCKIIFSVCALVFRSKSLGHQLILKELKDGSTPSI